MLVLPALSVTIHKILFCSTFRLADICFVVNMKFSIFLLKEKEKEDCCEATVLWNKS